MKEGGDVMDIKKIESVGTLPIIPLLNNKKQTVPPLQSYNHVFICRISVKSNPSLWFLSSLHQYFLDRKKQS